jgi:exonuclease VII small subunit
MRAIITAVKRLIVFILPSFLTVGLLIISIRFLPSNRQSVFPAPNSHATPISSNALNNDPVQTIESISRQAIETSNRTLQVIQWLVPIFVLSLLGVATNVAMSFSSTLKDATTKLNEMGRKYELVTQEFEKTHQELEKITNNYLNLQQDFVSIESQTLPFDLAAKAYERGRIDKQKYFTKRHKRVYPSPLFGLPLPNS